MRRHAISVFAAFATAITPLSASAEDEEAERGWSVSIGAGLVLAPSYLGDDNYQLVAAPNLAVKYGDDFFASFTQGVGYNVVNSGGWRIGPIAKYDFGRSEDDDNPFRIAGDDTENLDGLGDVHGTVELGAFAEYTFRPFSAKIELRQGVNGHQGLVGEVEAKFRGGLVLFDQRLGYAIGPRLLFGNETYNDAFFGIDAGQSARSGLDQSDADGGLLSYGLGASVFLPITESASAAFFAGYDRLTGDADDSSLVQDRGSRNQGVAGFFLTYEFQL